MLLLVNSTWSRSPGLFVNRETGAENQLLPAAAADFTGTVSEWYETLIGKPSMMFLLKFIVRHFVVVQTSSFADQTANILEFTAGFRANVTADADKGEIGAVKVGSLSYQVRYRGSLFPT